MKRVSATQRRRVLLGLQWYDHRVHQGVARYAREHNWYLDTRMVITHTVDPAWRGDGIISKLWGPPDLKALIDACAVPTVNVGRSSPIPEFECVTDFELDLDRFFRMVVEDLRARGFRNFALAGWMARSATRRFGDCADLFRRIVEERHGTSECLPRVPAWMDLHDALAPPARSPNPRRKHSEDERSILFLKNLQRLKKPVAIITADILSAVCVVDYCREVGLHVPDDVAVIGIDDIPGVWDSTYVPISCVDIDFDAWGYSAAALLDRLMDGKPLAAPYPVHAPKEIVTRGSSDVIAVHSATVRKALLFIRDNVQKGISVAQVVESAPVARRHLDLLFTQHLGHSISKEIDRVRMNVVRKLLIETDLTIAEIAAQAGHANALNLHRLFLRREGMAPGVYRRLQKACRP